jgi:2-desacetyl-2-hydroxyethyl bacteriochlorophyllide A dehydrogenase
MKALVYLGPRKMELQDVPDPAPGPGEVVVRIVASAICGSDLHGFREASPRRIPPLVMGHEVAGRVSEAGDGADPALVGTRVIVKPVVSCGTCARCAEGRPNLCPNRKLMGMNFPGGFADACVLPASQILPIPDDLSDDVASLTEPLANAVHTVARSVRDGDDVLVIGAGSIGLFAVRAAVLAGAERVFVADPLAPRLELAAAQGGRPLPAEDPAAAVAEATGGEGVDAVIDAAGFPSTWALALAAARFGGRVEAVGLGAVEGPISYHAVVSKGLTVTGSYACTDEDFERAVAFLARGDVRVDDWITHMPLSDGQRAFEALVDGTDLVKVVLTP